MPRAISVYVTLLLALLVAAACSRGSRDQAQEQTQQSPPQHAEQAQTPPDQPAPEAAAPEPQAAPEAAPSRSASRTRTPAQRSRTEPGKSVEKRAPEPDRTLSSDRSGGGDIAAPRVARSADASPASPPVPPRPQFATIPSGTKLEVSLTQDLGTDSNQTGDRFEAILEQPLEVNGAVVAPRGATVTGKLVRVDRPGRVEGKSGMTMTLTELSVGGNTYEIQTANLAFEGQATKKQDAAKVGAGAGIGAAIGAIAGGGKGAAIGAAVGAGAGGATVLATRGKDLKFPAEHRLTFVLRDDVRVRLR